MENSNASGISMARHWNVVRPGAKCNVEFLRNLPASVQACRIPLRLILPVQFQSKLKLAGVIGCRGLTGVGEQRTDGRYIVAVGDIECVGDEIHADALAEVDTLGNAHVIEDFREF